MNRLADVTRFVVPRKILKETERGLAPFSRREVEARVLWYGRYETQQTFRFTTAVVPIQECSVIDTVVEHDEILRQSKLAVDRVEELGAQVHTHPGPAYHSSIDNLQPIIREIGGLSIVIPEFCARPLDDLDHCAIFQITPGGWCGPFNMEKTSSLLRIPGKTEASDR